MHMNLGGNDLYDLRMDLDKLLLETAANHPGTIVVWLERSNLPELFFKYLRDRTKQFSTLQIVGDEHDQKYTAYSKLFGRPGGSGLQKPAFVFR